MNTTTTAPKGLNKVEYNALIHAMWRIDQLLNSPDQLPEKRDTLRRDRAALVAIFNRLTA